jgi:hypothetical protein
MQVVQTAEEPPNQGNICLAMMGWTMNSKKALVNTVEMK